MHHAALTSPLQERERRKEREKENERRDESWACLQTEIYTDIYSQQVCVNRKCSTGLRHGHTQVTMAKS